VDILRRRSFPQSWVLVLLVCPGLRDLAPVPDSSERAIFYRAVVFFPFLCRFLSRFSLSRRHGPFFCYDSVGTSVLFFMVSPLSTTQPYPSRSTMAGAG